MRRQARLAALVAHARAHSPFYRDRPPLSVTTKAATPGRACTGSYATCSTGTA
ncbi:hypothetical protein [Actinoplanes utahensis]|uniref:hypothetical protein n=1 Tax=Actinoplanes utahensis TaxID=1869 RepID=UPI000AE55C94|nr:hypothetical protein [Actinoplanes utahensis]GIF31522.1 hypothetical protein Aut01nite_45080 [Actinoplanes utahensis]